MDYTFEKDLEYILLSLCLTSDWGGGGPGQLLYMLSMIRAWGDLLSMIMLWVDQTC